MLKDEDEQAGRESSRIRVSKRATLATRTLLAVSSTVSSLLAISDEHLQQPKAKYASQPYPLCFWYSSASI
jgi:hypothetical protein